MGLIASERASRELLVRRARPIRRALFVSDLHLHGGDPAGLQRASRFLEMVEASRADALFLLGDLFLAWLGLPSLRDRALAPVLGQLQGLARRGVRVVLLHGNHDFLMGAELERQLGLEVAGPGLEVALGGARVLLVHGDVFCTRDRGYQRLHRVLRHPLALALWRSLPAAALEGVARRLVQRSSRSTAAKPAEDMMLVDEAVLARLARGPDALVCGHVHVARDGRLPVPGGRARIVVLADFERHGSFAEFSDGRLVLHAEDERFAAPPGPVLAIDGPAGSGKSSVARAVAEALGWVRLDSGALYRAVAAEALARRLSPSDPAVGALARRLHLATDAHGRVMLDGQPVADARLRSPAVAAAVSPVSAQAEVRAALLPVQRRAARGVGGLVAEGRDMGTVVFPDARWRVYLDARPEVRAARRLAQSPSEGRDLDTVAASLAERDARDAGRDLAPLAVAAGAAVLDTSELTLADVVAALRRLVGGAGC